MSKLTIVCENYLLASRQAGGLVLTDKAGTAYNLPENDNVSMRKIKQSISYGTAVKVVEFEDGTLEYRTAQMKYYEKDSGIVKGKLTETATNYTAIPETVSNKQAATMSMIHSSYEIKPEELKMTELKWKYLVRSVIRGKNIMMTGSAGSGKTMAAKAVANALDKKTYYFNLGATQDPRSTLIGNTHFSKEEGTFFSESLFVNAIQTENAVILLDELSRAHPEAWNILMTVLDEGQRYLRLDEHPDSPTVEVAKGVSFIATANQGNEYTSTRVLDRALMDRFVIIEMDLLELADELALLKLLYPTVDAKLLDSVANIANSTRLEMRNETPRISTIMSTRASVALGGLLYDGFSLIEAADVVIYPLYPTDGGVDSERTFIKQVVQKYVDADKEEDIFNTEEEQVKSDV